MEQKLKELGENGWELVCIQQGLQASSVFKNEFSFIFKREKDQ
jgi:hypothetical protein